MDKLSSMLFLMDFGLMKDVLRELSSLSLRLQSRSATVVISSSNIAETLRVFEGMKMAGNGKSVNAAQLACVSETAEDKFFKGIKLLNSGKSGIHAGQFLTAVADNLKACCLWETMT